MNDAVKGALREIDCEAIGGSGGCKTFAGVGGRGCFNILLCEGPGVGELILSSCRDWV